MPIRNHNNSLIDNWITFSILYISDIIYDICLVIGKTVCNIYRRWNRAYADIFLLFVGAAFIYVVINLFPSTAVSSADNQHVRFNIHKWLKENHLHDVFEDTGKFIFSYISLH